MKKVPIYRVDPDSEGFKIERMDIIKKSDGTLRETSATVTQAEMYRGVSGIGSGAFDQAHFDFYLAILVIIFANKSQKEMVRRVSAKGSRNIVPTTSTTKRYLKVSIEEVIMKRVTIKEVNKVINRAFVQIRPELGFPEVNPVEQSYRVTDEVISQAQGEECMAYLKPLKINKYIFPAQFKEIQSELKEKFPDEAKVVLDAIRSTKSRDHISAMAVTAENDETFITITNENGEILKVEMWKLLHMIESPNEGKRLHEFVRRQRDSPMDPFRYNNSKIGVVVGIFNAERSHIQVKCIRDEIKNKTLDQSSFIVDSNYLLCIYAAFKRLHDDQFRFISFREKAQTLIPFNVFEPVH